MFKNGSTILPSMTIRGWHANIHEHRHRNRHRCGNGHTWTLDNLYLILSSSRLRSSTNVVFDSSFSEHAPLEFDTKGRISKYICTLSVQAIFPSSNVFFKSLLFGILITLFIKANKNLGFFYFFTFLKF